MSYYSLFHFWFNFSYACSGSSKITWRPIHFISSNLLWFLIKPIFRYQYDWRTCAINFYILKIGKVAKKLFSLLCIRLINVVKRKSFEKDTVCWSNFLFALLWAVKSIIRVNASRIFWTGNYNKSYVFIIPFSFCAILIA